MQPATYTEEERLQVLKSYDLVNSQEEIQEQKELSDLTQLAATICGTPIALVTIIDDSIQWYKAKVGIDGSRTSRKDSFCQYTIQQDEVFEVYDALMDTRFEDNPFVKGDPHIRFYLGAPLINENGFRLGSMCVIDKVPRRLKDTQREALQLLAKQVANNFELRKSKRILESNTHLLEELVKQRTAELNRFVYSASHELRSPLKSILGLTALGKSELHKEAIDTQRIYLELIEKSTKKLDSTINDLINYSKNSEQEILIEHISLSDLIHRITNELIYYNTSMAIDVHIDIHEDIPLYTDKLRLTIILSNIISNAFKYQDASKNEHFVSIQVCNDELKCTIIVEDNGIGIAEEFSEKIFNMFFRAISDREGVGLGLYIVKEALLKLDGTCEVSSKIGEGSSFKLTIPNLMPK